ncbi:hypothetical protein CAL14_03705 [Bordetella genomosp. 9]|uniref:hypothetical protein n=1 Tax=Bordetella genomosp. 9 TaxID=1416803 RepID=UPI000A28FB79|nr:hypothetical protein [Bordetella genomosp. 9]ARP89506.1 hypothetical protein CAL14_03705 [Bordetella genomosp. 9]
MNDVYRFPTARTASTPAKVARGLGWFSIALGVAELAAPGLINRVCGLRARKDMVRLYGLREIACGVAILTGRNPRPWLWARVGGDMVDLASLAMADKRGPSALRTGMAAMNVAAVTALDVYAARSYPPDAPPPSLYGYGDRSGLPDSPERMRGVALKDFQMPDDMRVPHALAPWTTRDRRGNGAAGEAMTPATPSGSA